MGEGHLPVLVDEVIASLAIRAGSSAADCTVGGGGHAARILETSSPDGRLLGIDADQAAITEAHRTLERFGDRVTLRQANFEQLLDVASEAGFVPLDAALFDLGLSSYQLDSRTRGFSFSADAPPDMRFDEATGLSALELIDRSSERELAGILATFGEERHAGRIAKAILAARAEGRLMTAADLAAVVVAASPRPRRGDAGRIHPATRTFQALRIAVNDELGALGDWLAELPRVVARGGRAAAISFHSLEDRMVKQGFARLATGCICPPRLPVCACGRTAQWKVLTKKPVRAGEAELSGNPRARSARLRAVERLS
jgi:16S rRNA (cytosine1402-N4)-methyltransferase